MRRYRKVDPRIWNDEKVATLTTSGKLAFLFVLTHPNMTALGAMRGTLPGLAAELRISHRQFKQPFEYGLLRYDRASHFIYAPNWFRYNAPSNPNQVIALVDAFDYIPECAAKRAILSALEALLQQLGERLLKPFQERFGKPSTAPAMARAPSLDLEKELELEKDLELDLENDLKKTKRRRKERRLRGGCKPVPRGPAEDCPHVGGV